MTEHAAMPTSDINLLKTPNDGNVIITDFWNQEYSQMDADEAWSLKNIAPDNEQND